MSFDISRIDEINSPANCQLFFKNNDLKEASTDELARLLLKIAHLQTKYNPGVFDTYVKMIQSEVARRDNEETRAFTIKENKKSRNWAKCSFFLALIAFLIPIGKYLINLLLDK